MHLSPQAKSSPALLLLVLAGCAAPGPSIPESPAALRPPTDQVLLLETSATGVQIYDCVASKTQAGRFEWAFKAPEATLVDSGGMVVAKHFAGPSWQANDGSSVVGEVKARDAGPDANAVPWLLLSAKTTSGSGVFSKVTSVQRLKTSGGNAPSAFCSPEQAGEVLRVPYKASYYFYGLK